MLEKIVRAVHWVGEHWLFSLISFLLVAITATTIICWNAFGGEQKNMVPVYLYVTGLGEGKDLEGRELIVEEDDSITNIFMGNYPDIQDEFDSIVQNHTIQSFLGVQATGNKKFTVKVDGTIRPILDVAYVREGAKIEIIYG